jgi:hypothetical protein
MNLIKIVSISLLAFTMAACGGGSPSPSSSTSSSDGGTTTATDGTTTSTTITVGDAAIGTGTGSSYQDGMIQLENGGIVDGKLAAGGQVNISIDIVDRDAGNARIGSKEYGVVFASTCSGTEPAKASFDNPSQSVTSGKVTTTYRAEGCSGIDIVTASLYESTAGVIATGDPLSVAAVSIDVVPPTVNNISFVAASAAVLGINGVGNSNLPQVSTLTYKVADVNGDPISNQEVTFSLSSATSSASLANTSGITNEAGDVFVVLNAGGIQGSVTVIATASFSKDGVDDIRYVSSEVIAISTSFPVQSKMTLEASSHNPLTWEHDTQITLTADLADRWGNPPPDGTRILFWTEGGRIEPSCNTTDGRCAVSWNGQNRRPGNPDDTEFSGVINDAVGFSTITAYTQGEADFFDTNQDGLFDIGEVFFSYDEPFQDLDFDGVRNPVYEELLADSDNNGTYSVANPAIYQGRLCSAAAKSVGHCATNMHISRSLRIVMSGEFSQTRIFQNNAGIITEVTGFTLNRALPHYILIQDVNGNIPADGTTIGYTAVGFDVTGFSGAVPDGGVGLITAPVLPGVSVGRGWLVDFGFSDQDPADNPANPTAEILITGVDGKTLKLTFDI